MPSIPQPVPPRDDSPSRQRKLSRRDSNDAADRALKSKYSHISADRLDAIVDKNGVSLVEAVRDELKKMKSTDQYVKTQFWIDLQQRYDLEGATVFDGLEEPDQAETVSKELWDCLQQARCSNPSTRTPLPFIRCLQYCDGLNDTEIYGALHGVKPQINISSRHSEMMTIALLDFKAEKNRAHAADVGDHV